LDQLRINYGSAGDRRFSGSKEPVRHPQCASGATWRARSPQPQLARRFHQGGI